MDRGSWFFAGGGAVKAPAGLVLPIKPGVSLDSDWAIWTAANSRFLRGTESDTVVGTIGARYSLGIGSGSGGGHVGPQSPYICDRGWYGKPCGSQCRNPSNNPNNVGSHSGHYVSVYYAPGLISSQLIQAQGEVKIPLGAIMFADADNSHQSPYATFNSAGAGKLFYAYPTFKNNAQSAGVSSVGNASGDHNHFLSASYNAMGVIRTYTSLANAGGTHNHGVASFAASHAMSRCIMRAFEIIDDRSIKGLIGMWPLTGVPDKWELVANMKDRFLEFSSTGVGSMTGNNTVSYSGSLGNAAHAHAGAGTLYCIETAIPHGASEYHGHGFSATQSYLPERYNIKFIRYTG